MSLSILASRRLVPSLWAGLPFVAALWLALAGTPDAHGAESSAVPAGSPQVETIRYGVEIHYLAAPAEDPVLAAREQARRDGRRLKLVHQLPARPDEPVIRPALRSGPGASDLPAALRASQRVLQLEFAYPRSRVSEALRVATRLAEQVARETGGLLWDEGTRELFTPDEWRRARVDGWADEGIEVARHVIVQTQHSADAARLVTRGMARFGLPEIAVERVPPAASRAMRDLLQGVAQALAEGAPLPRAGELDLDLRSLRQPDAHARQARAMKAGASGVARMTLMQTEPGTIELRFDRQPGADSASRQLALLVTTYGRGEAVPVVAASRPPSVEEVAREVARGVASAPASPAAPSDHAARSRLPALRDAFAAGLPPRETIQLKAPFAVAEGGLEWMWVEVLSWSGDAVVGVLKSQPRLVAGLAAGQIVNVRQRDVVDYLHRRADGTQEGNSSAAPTR